MRDELAIFAGQTPHALKTLATPSWLILRLHYIRNDPQRIPLSSQRDNFPDRILLRLVRDEPATVAAPESERQLPAEISLPCLLVRLHLPNSLADAVALGLCEGNGDGQE